MSTSKREQLFTAAFNEWLLEGAKLATCKAGYVAVFWSIEDVREVRPDLTDEQCMAVLEDVAGDEFITDSMIGYHANNLYPKTAKKGRGKKKK